MRNLTHLRCYKKQWKLFIKFQYKSFRHSKQNRNQPPGSTAGRLCRGESPNLILILNKNLWFLLRRHRFLCCRFVAKATKAVSCSSWRAFGAILRNTDWKSLRTQRITMDLLQEWESANRSLFELFPNNNLKILFNFSSNLLIIPEKLKG